jgi:hypothetical protein
LNIRTFVSLKWHASGPLELVAYGFVDYRRVPCTTNPRLAKRH